MQLSFENSPNIVGIVNITTDSFSDGGKYLAPDDAVRHGVKLYESGADIVELGAASSHPDAEAVSAAVELDRLQPVVRELTRMKVPVGVDSWQPQVQSAVAAAGIQMVNDIKGFPDPPDAVMRSATCSLVVMHSVQGSWRADRRVTQASSLLDRISIFLEDRISSLIKSGISKSRLIIDPGMGFFLGANRQASLAILRQLPVLESRFAMPIMVSVSRKSFLQDLTGRAPGELIAGTVAAELYCAAAGASYIRTHDVAALRDALKVMQSLTEMPT
jgi:dihydropteroate synthase type 2